MIELHIDSDGEQYCKCGICGKAGSVIKNKTGLFATTFKLLCGCDDYDTKAIKAIHIKGAN